MKSSQYPIRTLKSSNKEFNSKNATYLIKAGFVDQTMSGVYSYLPLGLRVLNKIEAIVREEMNKIGIEVLLPALSPKELWETTGRLNSIDVLIKTSGANEISKSKNTDEYILNCTHEDVITPIVKLHASSYKNLPVALYQIQNKFRNEARAKSGVLRTREFRMKDLYSFHATQEDFERYYEIAKQAYIRVFERLGISELTYLTLASGGDFTERNSHEFQTRCDAGEDLVFRVPSTGECFNLEIAPSKAIDPEQDNGLKEVEEVFGEGLTGMESLVKFLKVPANKCVKTLVYETEGDKVVVAAVRGDYEVNELKLKKVTGFKRLSLASEQTIKELLNSYVGYVGIVNLPEDERIVRVFDDSIENLINFECGSNKKDYHSINVNWERDLPKPDAFFDVKLAKEGDIHPSGEAYEVFSACEVGNIFPLESKFTSAFKYLYTNESGALAPVIMGSYGIGTTRLVGVVAEVFSDERGLVWPEAISPFNVHLVTIGESENISEASSKLYEELQSTGLEILWDDRNNVGTGEKLSDADLIGIPYRVILSNKSLEAGGVELKLRSSEKAEIVSIEELIRILKK